MTYRLDLMIVTLCALPLGCANSPEETQSGETDRPGTATSTDTGGARDVDSDEEGTAEDGGTTHGHDGTTGTVDDGTSYGMSDDVPLAAEIPDVKQGMLDIGTWVLIEQVPATTRSAILDGHEWFYVQDPLAREHMGLRVELPAGVPAPDFGRWLDLTGRVRYDDQGWVLQLEVATEGTDVREVEPRAIDVATLYSSSGVQFDDALVDLVGSEPLQVTGFGFEPGTVLVSDDASGEAVIVDLRPFDLQQLPISPGMRLLRLVGVVEIGGGRPVVLPRTAEDLGLDG